MTSGNVNKAVRSGLAFDVGLRFIIRHWVELMIQAGDGVRSAPALNPAGGCVRV